MEMLINNKDSQKIEKNFNSDMRKITDKAIVDKNKDLSFLNLNINGVERLNENTMKRKPLIEK